MTVKTYLLCYFESLYNDNQLHFLWYKARPVQWFSNRVCSSLTSKCAMGLLISIQVSNTHTINNPQITIMFNEEHPVLQTLCRSAVENHWPSRPTQLEKTDLPLTLKHHSGFTVICSASSGSVHTQFRNRSDTASHIPDHSWRIQCLHQEFSSSEKQRYVSDFIFLNSSLKILNTNNPETPHW